MDLKTDLKTEFDSVEHAFASVASDIVKGARAVSTALHFVQKEQPVADVVATEIAPMFPMAVPIERSAFAVLGIVLRAVDGVDAAAAQNGVNLTLDANAVQSLQAILPTIKQQAAALGIQH